MLVRAILCLSFAVILQINSSFCQKRYSEEDVNLQKMFIDATREKILGNYENAIGLLKQILKEDKDNHVAFYELARMYDAIGEGNKAISTAKKAIDQAPQNIWYQRFLADIYQKIGKNKDAAKVYETLVKLDPGNDFYYSRWAYFLVRANEIEKAVKVYDALEKQVGINEDVIRRKHTLYLGIGDNKKAAKELERLIKAFPNQTRFQHLLASFYEQIGETSKAKGIYREILKLDPQDSKAQLAMAGASRSKSNDVKYLESLKPIFLRQDVNIDLKIGKILPFINKVAETGDQSLATASLELTKILEATHPDQAKAFSASGDLLYHSGQKEAALEKYKKTLDLDDSVFLVWEQMMAIYQEQKNYNHLLKLTNEALDIFPNKAIIYYYNGVANKELKQYKDAQDALEQGSLMVGKNLQLRTEFDRLLEVVRKQQK